MTTLLLVRHGTTAATGSRLGGRTPASLDERGREQVQATADRIAPLRPRAVYASPVVRTRETAAIIARALGRDVVDADGLAEVDYGSWTNRPLKPLTRTKRWPVIQRRPSLVAFPEGETIRGAQLRAVDEIEAIVARHRRQTVVAVSHADVIKAVVAFYLGMHLDVFQRLHVAPASISVLALAPGERPTLLRFNDDGPLQPPATPPRRASGTRRAPRPAAAGGDGSSRTGSQEAMR